jgi:nicotinamide-nucleotide adenylyltransferase
MSIIRKPDDSQADRLSEIRNLSPPAAYRPIIEEVASCAEPAARLVMPLAGIRSLAVLPGAYNPPTKAHLALSTAALERAFDAVAFSVGTVTIDKSEIGLGLDERLHLLCEICREEPRWSVVLHNRGLYAEQAEALRRSFPEIDRLVFVVGMDKVGQIFDPRYYADFGRSLGDLFDRARLLVAARGTLDRAALDQLLEQGPARPFAHRIEWLELDPQVRDVSATAIRERLARGEPVSEWLPSPVERYLRGRGAIFRE